MKPSFSLSLIVLARLITDASSVAVVIRSEKKASVELDARGGMRSVHTASMAMEMCNVDFALGKPDSCDCEDPANHEVIATQEMCIEAAVRAGADHDRNNFLLASEWFDHHPKGCFKDTCASGQCYFFNPADTVAQCRNFDPPRPDQAQPQVTGVPVCRRKKLTKGTSAGAGACHVDYGVIMDEDDCTEAQVCLGECRGQEQFRVFFDASKDYNNFSKGCFIDDTDGCVYFNAPQAADPTSPKGTPICDVSAATRTSGSIATGSSIVNVTDRAGPSNAGAAGGGSFAEVRAATSAAGAGSLPASAADDTDTNSENADDCRLDYPLGPEGGCTCQESTDHQLVVSEEVCMQAATQAGVTAPWQIFVLKPEWYDHHPRGCFKQHCSTDLDPKGICYFYNPTPLIPRQCNATHPDATAAKVTGQPVCSRPRFKFGKVPDSNVNCPVGYSNILDELSCSLAVNCLPDDEHAGTKRPDEFRVTAQNQSKHDDYPQGCFKSSEDGLIYYNPALENWELPKKPIGTPLCNVSTTTFFKDGAAAGTPTKDADGKDIDMSSRAKEATNGDPAASTMQLEGWLATTARFK